MASVWIEGSPARAVGAPLTGEQRADVAIVGGGITGLMTALALHEVGIHPVVVEAHAVGASNTGRSTGNLYGTVSQGLAVVRRKWGGDVARHVVALRSRAVNRIELLASTMTNEASFRRVPLRLAVVADDDKAREL